MIERLRALLCGCGVALAAFSGIAAGVGCLAWTAILVAVASAWARRPFEAARVGSLAIGAAAGVLAAPGILARFGAEAAVVAGVALAAVAVALPATAAGDRSWRSLGSAGVVALVAAAVALSGREATTFALTASNWDASCAAAAIAAWCAELAIGAAVAARLVERHPKLLRVALVALPVAHVAMQWAAPSWLYPLLEYSEKLHRPDASHGQFVGGVALFTARSFGLTALAGGAALAVAAHVGCRWSGLALAACLAGAGAGVALPVGEPRIVSAAVGAIALAFLAPLVFRRFGGRVQLAGLAVAAVALAVVPRTVSQRFPPDLATQVSSFLEAPLLAPERLRELALVGPGIERRADLLVDLSRHDRVDLALIVRISEGRAEFSGFGAPPRGLAKLADGLRWERLLLRSDLESFDPAHLDRRQASNRRMLLRTTPAPPGIADRASAELDSRARADREAAALDADGLLQDRLSRAMDPFFADIARRDRVDSADQRTRATRKLFERRDAGYDDASVRQELGRALLSERGGRRALAAVDELSRSFELRLVSFDAMGDRDAALLFAAARGMRRWAPLGPVDAFAEVRKSAARLPEIDDPLLRARALRVIATAERADPATRESAAEHLAEARGLDPYDTNVIREIARLALDTGDVAAARVAADDAVALDPLEPESHLLAARAAGDEAARRASIARYLRLSGAALDLSSSAPAR